MLYAVETPVTTCTGEHLVHSLPQFRWSDGFRDAGCPMEFLPVLPVASCVAAVSTIRGGRQHWLLPEPEGDSKTFLARRCASRMTTANGCSICSAWRRASRAAGLLSTSVGASTKSPEGSAAGAVAWCDRQQPAPSRHAMLPRQVTGLWPGCTPKARCNGTYSQPRPCFPPKYAPP